MSFLLPELAPATDAIYFVKATAEQIVEALRRLDKQSYVKSSLKTKTFRANSLVDTIRRVLPGNARESYYLLIPTASEWTAFVDVTGPNGPDVNTTPRLISEFGSCDVVVASAVNDTEKAHNLDSSVPLVYGSVRFDFYVNGKCMRVLQVANSGSSGKWIFYEHGDHLSAESLENYKKRLVRDRFTTENLSQLLYDSFGIRFLDLNFYQPEQGCLLITRRLLFLGIL